MQEPAVTLETPTLPQETPQPPPEGAPAEPAPEPPVEGQGEPQEGQVNTWENLEKNEWFPAALEERDRKRDEERGPGLQRDAEREAYKKFDPHQQRAEASFATALQVSRNAVEKLNDLVEDGTLSATELKRWARDNADAWGALTGSHWGKGVEYILGQLAATSGDPNVMPTMSVRLSRILRGEADAQGNVRPAQDDTFLTDFLGKLVGAKTEGMVSKEDAEEMAVARSKKVLNEYKTALAAEQQAKGGAPVGAFAPGSPAGSTDKNKARRDYAEGRISTTEAEKLGIV